MTRVNMGKRIYNDEGKHGKQDMQARVYRMTRVNMGKQDIQGYTV